MNVQRQLVDMPVRRKWTAEEFVRLYEIGVFTRADRLQLLEGDIYQMPAKGNRHDLMHRRLNRHLQRVLPDEIVASPEASLYLASDSIPEPDLAIFPDALLIKEVTPADVLLAIEVSDTTLGFDLGIKARIYARSGVAHCWVIDVRGEETHVHAEPGEDGYTRIERIPFAQALPLPFDANIVVQLDALITR